MYIKILLLIVILMGLTCSGGGGSKMPVPPADWMNVATVGGLALDQEISDSEMIALLNDFVNQNATVVEVDGTLSEYITEEVFERELEIMRKVATYAHDKNLKVVWYYPSLESITIGGEESTSSMYKDHPTWVQLSIDGTVNVFYGSLVFWVDPGDESAWLSPLTPYRQYYLDRVKKIAATGIDGIWVDVPLYNDIVGKWTSHTPEEKAQFKADTGYNMPTVSETPDAAWWRWIQWRHDIIDTFQKDIFAAAREVNPDFYITVETVTMDYNAAVNEGLDGSFTGPLDGFWHVWEVDAISDTNSMVNAPHDDWLSMLAMFKYGRGADRGRPAWAFVYGYEPEDAETVLTLALAAQCNPYELKIPQMTTTVGADYRTRVFGWILDYQDEIFRSTSQAKIALIHSSSSRDYIDGTCIVAGSCGVSLYSKWNRPDPNMAWWTNSEPDSIDYSNYIAEYKGFTKALVHLHQPFDIQPSRLITEAILNNYEMIVLPDYRSLTDAEATLIKAYVQNGGHAFITGEAPGTLDENAVLRGTNALAEILDIDTPAGTCSEKTYGQGSSTYCKSQIGKSYFVSSDSNAFNKFSTAVTNYSSSLIQTDADDYVHMALYKRDNKLVLHIVNLVGANGDFSIIPQTIHVALDISSLPSVSSVIATSSRLAAPETIAFTQNANQIEFDITVDINKLVIIN
ncbi:MAG: family 10 glycosylhydrolase [Pseudomonadota bacterium]